MPYKGEQFSEPLVLGCFGQITINFETNVGSIGKIQVGVVLICFQCITHFGVMDIAFGLIFLIYLLSFFCI